MPEKHIPITDQLFNYAIAQRSDANDPVLASLHMDTLALGEVGRMAITPDHASLLSLLVGLINAKWAVEVGTFTGISSIAIARHLAQGASSFPSTRISSTPASRGATGSRRASRTGSTSGWATRTGCCRTFGRAIRSILSTSMRTRRRMACTTSISVRSCARAG